MNANRLLVHYERIADASDAIARLRGFILNLAVRGKLVPQDPNEEPAAELLKRIAAEKARLVKAGEIRNPKQVAVIDASECFFGPPRGWEWRRLLEISRKIHYGFTASANNTIDAVRLLRITDIHDNSVDWFSVPGCEIGEKALPQFKLEKGDILVARTGGTIGKSLLVQDVPVTVVFASYLIRVQGSHEIYDRYLKLFLESPIYWIQLQDGSRGAGQPNVNGQTLGKMLVPLPPLAEQHRIVAKVDELTGLCDRLEAARTEREATRDRMAAASLVRLNDPDPDPVVFRNHAAFAIENLTPLTTRTDQIKALRQTILNLAVRGKMVPQDPNDEPAAELLKRIAKEKAGESKKTKPAISLTSSITRCDVPSGWVITDLQSVCASITDGDHLPPPKTESGIPFLVIGNVRSQTIEFTGSRFVSPEYYEALDPIRRPRSGDLLYTLVGSYGIPVVVRDNQPFCVQRHIGILRPSNFIDVGFLARAMESRLVFEQATACAAGIAQKTVPLSGLRRLLIPIPPLAEQHRIVTRADELIALCDRLEASLSTGDDTRRRLLDALLHEVLVMGADRKSVA